MQNITRLLELNKRDRTPAQLATLTKYFKNVKIFKDMLLGGTEVKEDS